MSGSFFGSLLMYTKDSATEYGSFSCVLVSYVDEGMQFFSRSLFHMY